MYAIAQIFITKYIIKKYNQKLGQFPTIIDGGDEVDRELEQAAIQYSKTKNYKWIEFLKKVF